MKYLFIILGVILLGHGIYLIFGGEYLRTDKVFFIDLFGGIAVYMLYFVAENAQYQPLNDHQRRHKKSMWRNLIAVEVCCTLLLCMSIFGLK